MMAAVTQAYSTHIHEVLSDRHIMTGLEVKVEQAMRNEDAELPHLILSIDAMDKAKWQIPRQLDSSKRLAALWRPSLHFVGVLMPGVMEYYAILEADQPSNSDSQQTILARALEHAEEIITSRGKKMPGRIIIQSDNTAKEGRNSQMMTWAALLVQAAKFREVSLMLFRVGHTHCRLDQRFGVIGAKLALARSLESPAEYVSYLQEHYTPSRGPGEANVAKKNLHLTKKSTLLLFLLKNQQSQFFLLSWSHRKHRGKQGFVYGLHYV